MEHSTSKGWVRKKGRKKEIKDGRKEGRKLRMEGRKEGNCCSIFAFCFITKLSPKALKCFSHLLAP
jgi:hypothetical protein